MSPLSFDSHGTRCEGTWFQARNDSLGDAAGRRPCVVMAHGFGATRDSGLAPFAERFAAAGLHVLTFDYRGFGTSGGRLRQDVDHRRHREDYRSALAAVRSRAEVDPDRVALWGTSYSGGHVIAVAAGDARVRAVVSQGAAMDGLAAVIEMRRTIGTGKALALAVAGLRDLARAATRQEPLRVPLAGPVGSRAVITAPGADEAFLAIAGPTFRNEMCARGLLRIPFNRPVRYAAEVCCPVLLVVAERDDVVPVSAVHEVARRLARGGRPVPEQLSFPCRHFDIYVDEIFEQSSAAQVEFLTRQLARPGREERRR